MPQLNPEFFISQLFWLAVFFSILFIFLWRVSLPRIANVLEARQSKINSDLSTAKELQEKALEVEKSINDQINLAKNESDEQIKNTITSIQQEVASKLTLLDKELEEKISNSENEILKNKNDQMKNIDEEISNITKITISKFADIKLDKSEIDQAIDSIKGKTN